MHLARGIQEASDEANPGILREPDAGIRPTDHEQNAAKRGDKPAIRRIQNQIQGINNVAALHCKKESGVD